MKLGYGVGIIKKTKIKLEARRFVKEIKCKKPLEEVSAMWGPDRSHSNRDFQKLFGEHPSGATSCLTLSSLILFLL